MPCPSSPLQVDCATKASVSNLPGDTPTVASGPPQLVMLPTNASSSPTWLDVEVAAAEAGIVTSNNTVYLLYNTPSPLSLMPCASLAAANVSNAATCAAAAFDTLSGADLCDLIDVHDVSTIDGQAKCTASTLTLGTCLPGQYTLQYTVTNAAGESTFSFLLVLVEMRISAGYSYVFIPEDRCGLSILSISLFTCIAAPIYVLFHPAFPLLPCILTNAHALRSWNETSVTRLSELLRSDASVAVSLVARQLPEFGVNAASIRSVTVNSTSIVPIATDNGTAYHISIQLTVVLVSSHFVQYLPCCCSSPFTV